MPKRREWMLVILVTAIPCLFGAGQAGAAVPLCGDFNRSETITSADALGTLRCAVGVIRCRLDVCDFNGDSKVTSRDALAVLRTAVGTGPEPQCPLLVCNGPDCHPTCPIDALDCCDEATCSGQGTCTVEEGLAVCACDEGWVGVACNAPADRYPFATDPGKDPPVWSPNGDLWVRPPSFREQRRYGLRPGTFFIANSKLVDDVTAGEKETTMPLAFPDGQLDRFDMEIKDSYTSEVRLVERRSMGSFADIVNRFPEVTIYRSLYETDGSVRSVMQILAVENGGFVSRGLARHESNMPGMTGVFGVSVSPVSSTMQLDEIAPESGEIDDSTLLISEAYTVNPTQAGLFDNCNGLALCTDLCADTGLEQGDPGPACPPPPDPCQHVSPCGDGHGPGNPTISHHCNDGVDNDGDGLTDSSDPQCNHYPTCQPGGDIPVHGHFFEAGADFGMFGDVVWCTKKGDNWPSVILDRGYLSETPFHKNTGNAPYDSYYKWGKMFYDSHKKLVRLKVMGCWRLPSEQEAADCSDDLADCGPFASGPHTYPYRFGRFAEGMWDGLKVDVWHARSIGMTDPLNLAHTVAGNLIGNSEAESIPGFASVAGSNVNTADASPHEIGHTLNLTHCDVRKVGNDWTMMGNSQSVQTCPPGDYGSHTIVRFSDASGQKLRDCFADGCLRTPQFGDPTP